MMFNNVDKVGVSVVICVYNGRNRIKDTLYHLSKQKNIDFNWEVLIIDNNSTDDTVLVAQKYWATLTDVCPLRIITETQKGAMHARKNGILNSNYRYLLFCDDDNWFHDGYVQFAFDKILNHHHIAAIGGCGELEFEKDFIKPEWIDRYANFFGCSPQGKEDGDTTFVKGCLYTAGAILDRVWLNKLYESGFDSILKGRDGKSLVAGEDTELTYGLTLLGGKLYYYSDMKFKHFMPSERITWAYFKKLVMAIGTSNYILIPYNRKRKMNVLSQYVNAFGLLAKYYIKSLSVFFKEGDENVKFYYMFLGQLKGVKMSTKTDKKIQEIVDKINDYRRLYLKTE